MKTNTIKLNRVNSVGFFMRISSLLPLIMLASQSIQAMEWLNPMPDNVSQISINFVSLLGDKQATIINKGLNSAIEKHYLAGVLLQEKKPVSLALIVANLNQELSGFQFDLNDVKVKAKCTRLNRDVAEEFLRVKSEFAPSANLYSYQMSSLKPWHTFRIEQNTNYFINKLNDNVGPNSISICEIPSQFL